MPVEKAVEKATEAATSDLLTFRSRFFREVGKGKKARLEPIEVTAHLNPVSIAIGAAMALAGTLAGMIAWHGVDIPNPLGGAIEAFPGLKDTALGKDLTRWYEARAVKRRIIASGGEVVEARSDLSPEEIEVIKRESVGDAICELLNREWQTALRQGKTTDADRFLQQAKDGNCPWAQGR